MAWKAKLEICLSLIPSLRLRLEYASARPPSDRLPQTAQGSSTQPRRVSTRQPKG
jgi:hypothetical protein